MPLDAFHIWQFLAIRECDHKDEEDIQEMDGMWFRKASIAHARTLSETTLRPLR